MPSQRPTDFEVKEIRFEYGIGILEYNEGLIFTLSVTYDRILNTYKFDHLGVKYSFEVTASLGGINPVDIMCLVDFGQLANPT